MIYVYFSHPKIYLLDVSYFKSLSQYKMYRLYSANVKESVLISWM
jgi:hypothetical protein